MSTVQKLSEMKEKIEKAKTEFARLEGRAQETERRMKEEFKVNTLDEARTKLTEMQDMLDKLDAEVDAGVESLEKKMKAQETL